MCGSIRAKCGGHTYELEVRPRVVVPRQIILHPSGRFSEKDLLFSSHRFIKSERIMWWSKQLLAERKPWSYAQIMCDQFSEYDRRERSRRFFNVQDEDSVLKAIVHYPLNRFMDQWDWKEMQRTKTWTPVISILTEPSMKYPDVAKIHHRVPVLDTSYMSEHVNIEHRVVDSEADIAIVPGDGWLEGCNIMVSKETDNE